MNRRKLLPQLIGLTLAFLALVACGAEPTATLPPPTEVVMAPTDTPTTVPPSDTPVPPTDTPTTVPPTDTPVPPTHTPAPMNTPTPTETPTPISGFVSGFVDVGGYKLFMVCRGVGTPTVIIDVGYFETTRDWTSIQSEVSAFTQVCVYDRAGLGRSQPGPTPRTSRRMVRELDTLLVNAGIEAPYVLVGHQIGGYNALVFAHEHADKVAGIVLADSNPTEWERFEEYLPDQFVPAIPPSFEGIDVLKSAEQASATDDLGNKPLIVLTGDHGHTFMWEGLSEDILLQIEQTYLNMQEELAGLSSNGTYIRVEGGSRHVYESHPERVVSAIQTVVEAVRGE